MPNSYSTVPSIIPGGLTVGGNLTVQGNTIVLGSYAAKGRLQMLASGALQMTANQDDIAGAQDNGGISSQGILLHAGSDEQNFRRWNASVPSSPVTLLDFLGGVASLALDTLKVGAAAPFARLAKTAGGIPFLSSNMGIDLATRDDGAKAAFALLLDAVNGLRKWKVLNAAGAAQDDALVARVFTDYVQHAVTGTVAETTVYTKTIRGNTVLAGQAILVTVRFNQTALAGGTDTVRVKLGGTTVFSDAAIQNEPYEVTVLIMCTASNAQVSYGADRHGTTQATQRGTAAIDMTADTTVTVTEQLGNVGNNRNYESCVIEVVNTYGPVA